MLHYIFAQVGIQVIFRNPSSHSLLLWVYDLMFFPHFGYYPDYHLLFPLLLHLRLLQFTIIYPVQQGWYFILCVYSIWLQIGRVVFTHCASVYASDFSCDYPRYTSCFSTAQHPCIPAVDLFSRVFTLTVVCDLASGRLFYFFCLLSTALNSSSCESFAVFHTISRAVSYMRLANLKNRNGLRVRWVKCSIDPTDFWCEAITS